MSRKYPSLWARVLANCTVDADGCWIWQGSHARSRNGRYPQMSVRLPGNVHKTRLVCRLVAELVLKREIDSGLETIEHHSCGKTSCIKPNCLGLMENADNARARWARGSEAYEEIPLVRLVDDERVYWHPSEEIPF